MRVDKNYIGVGPKFFSVLEFLVREGAAQHAISVQNMAKELPFARTTLHRILYTLEKLRYVEKGEGRGYYRLGLKFFELTEPAIHFRQLLSVAKSVMVDLMIRFSETVNLGVLDGGQVAYIDVIESPSSLRIAATPGVMEHLASVREQGVAFDLEENVEGVICVAAPIFDQRGRVVASLSVSGPASRMESKLTAIQEGIRNAGLKISRMLGPRSVTVPNSEHAKVLPNGNFASSSANRSAQLERS